MSLNSSELSEGRPSRFGLYIPNSPYGLCGLRTTSKFHTAVRAQELCDGRCGRFGLPVPKSPYSLCGRNATLKLLSIRGQELCGSRGSRPGLPVPNRPYGLCGRKATKVIQKFFIWDTEKGYSVVFENCTAFSVLAVFGT